jgi:hypothetical protein
MLAELYICTTCQYRLVYLPAIVRCIFQHFPLSPLLSNGIRTFNVLLVLKDSDVQLSQVEIRVLGKVQPGFYTIISLHRLLFK